MTAEYDQQQEKRLTFLGQIVKGKSGSVWIWTIIIGAVFLGTGYLLLFAGLPGAEEIKSYQPPSTVKPDHINWNKRTTNPIRLWVPIQRISPLLQKAVIISEDDTFYQHDGINYEMMKEAFRVNLEKGRYVRGASTITMQLARNAFLHKRKTLLRKIRELILARRLEKNLSKRRILELYLNVVEWGEGIYGAEAASRYYFGKSAAHLNLAEATLLASMLPNPKYFDPFKRLKSVQRMQKRVVWLMENAREINPEQAQWALTGISLRGGISPQEIGTTTVDSLEEAKYLEPLPMETPPSPLPHTPKPVLSDSLAFPDTSAVSDSSAVIPQE
ncbi:MAG: monofunctional biosynthetic peptidoglycan transglycosylase [candidate division KSB1 bacterium]|nr:monofunctional biosynthetic peptidoglycan transglycosylase [candidate division KSB1 bacterium]MDZ7301536.1 monofunctional biosynthetic peptidoglycan transglycosylase [candidate division KSB1 bacterium]MDZ7311048.1 monofunctional biosynthetic peptidoglycan transglycosylase [candidate division KSB1 bacterium]